MILSLSPNGSMAWILYVYEGYSFCSAARTRSVCTRANFERRVPIVMVLVGSTEADGDKGSYVVTEGAVSNGGRIEASMLGLGGLEMKLCMAG